MTAGAATQYTEALAELVVRTGVNLTAGQDVVVLACDIEHAALARAVADAAYRAGAHYVSVFYWDQTVKRSRLLLAAEDSLSYTPGWWDAHLEEARENHSAYVILWGDPDVDLLAAIDPARAGRDTMPLTGPLHALFGSGEVSWTIVPAASRGAARRILGSDDLEALWAVLAPILRLDAPDPVAAWRDHVARLHARAAAMQAHGFDAVHFHGGDTDLTVGLMRGASWLSGSIETNWGQEMVVNMPTEEVFTTPDRSRVDGVAVATRRFQLIGGTNVDGLRVRFEHGRVVEIDADSGVEAARARLGADEGASRLGEVALVDENSPVGRSGLVFNDILLDENAACHIAFGNAYPFTVPDLPTASEDRLARGFNISDVHQDVMIGGPAVSVDGLDTAGNRTPILRENVWVLE